MRAASRHPRLEPVADDARARPPRRHHRPDDARRHEGADVLGLQPILASGLRVAEGPRRWLRPIHA